MHTVSSRIRALAPLMADLLLPALASAQERPDAPHPSTVGVRQSEQHILVDPARLEWKPAPAVLPAGAQATVLEGDPTKPGLFTMRLRLPDDYRIRPHFHDADEHVTVLSGTFVVGLGETWSDTAGTALAPGGYAVMPAGTRHFARTRGETVLQIHAVGPWALTYVNPADDPRTTSRDR